jgi:hypothetical protein
MGRSVVRFTRRLVGGGLLGVSAVAFALYADGRWDPFPIGPPPSGSLEAPGAPVEDASGLGIGRANDGFVMEQLARPVAGVSTSVGWRATGASFVPLDPPARGYAVREPRLWIAGKDGATEVVAPLGSVTSPTAPGPMRADLQGGVHVDEPHGSLETDHLALSIPPERHGAGDAWSGDGIPLKNLALDRRANHGRIETDAPVRARWQTSDAAPLGTSTITLTAEHGASGDASLHRLLLRGPVHARDDEGRVRVLEAHDYALVSFVKSRADLFAWDDGPCGALGGLSSLAPTVGRGARRFDLERIEARGAVELAFATEGAVGHEAVDLHVSGDWVLADLARGVLVVTGSPGVVEEKHRGERVRGKLIILRDLGDKRIDFAALGDAELTTAPKTTRASVPRVWRISGEEALGTLANDADPGERPELAILDAAVWPKPFARGFAGSADETLAGAFDLLLLEKARSADEAGALVVGRRDTIRALGRGRPVQVSSRESQIDALEVRVVQEKNAPDLVRLSGRVRAHLGADLAAMAAEKKKEVGETASPSSLLASGGPWDVSGERVDLDLWPKPVEEEREAASWEKSALLRARADGPGEITGASPSGAAVHVAGASIDVDLVSGKLAVESRDGPLATATVGSSTLVAREIRGDLRTGQGEARGSVHARRELAPGATGGPRFVTLDAAKATARVEPDEGRLAALRKARANERKLGRRELAPPPELLAATADGEGEARARLATNDGASIEADRFEWDAAQERAFARSTPGGSRVHYRSGGDEAFAREAELEVEPALAAYRLELTGEVHAERGTGADRLALDADRARANALAVDDLGHPRIVWGPVVAWSQGERPVVVTSVDPAPVTAPMLEARGRILRLFPDTRTGVFEGATNEPFWFARGRECVRALEKDPSSIERPGAIPAVREERPMAVRAPEATFVLEPYARAPRKKEARPKASSDDRDEREAQEERKAEDFLRALRSLHVPGPIVAHLGEQTVHAQSLEYDGSRRCATLLGDPVRVADPKGRVEEFRRFTYPLGDPNVKDR